MARTTTRQRVVLGVTLALLVVGSGVAVARSGSPSGVQPGLPDRATEATEPDAGDDRGRKKEDPTAHVPRQVGTGLTAADLAAAGKKARLDPVVVTKAVASVDTSLDALFEPLPEGEQLDLPPTIGEQMAEEISNTVLERQDLGWTVEGAATLDGLAIVEVDDPKDPAAMTIRTCVDTSDVIVRNTAGRDMTSGTVTRSLSLFDLALVEGDWTVRSRTFADNPDC